VRDVDAASLAASPPDNNILAWRDEFPSSSRGIKMVRSGNWKAVCDHAKRQIESWDLEKNETLRAEDRLRNIQQSVHDVLRSGTDGPGSKWWTRWIWLVLEHFPVLRWDRVLGNENPPLKHWRMTRAMNKGHARDIPDNACKHWSVAKLRACQVNGVGALDLIKNDADKKFQFEEHDSSPPGIRRLPG